MSEKKSNWLIFLVIVLIVLQIFTLVRINWINNRMDNLDSRLSNSAMDTRDTLSNLSYTIEQQLAEGASIIDSYSYACGALNEDDLTIDLTFTVAPKELAEDTTAMLEINGKNTVMERSGDSFSAAMNVGLFDSILQPKVIFERNGVRQQESIDMSLEPRYEALPQLYAWLERKGGSTTFKAGENGGGTYYLSGSVQIDTADKTAADGGKSGLYDLRLMAMVDGKKVWQLLEKDFPGSSISGGRSDGTSAYLEISEPVEMPLQPGQTLTVYVTAEDKYGLVHQVILDQITLDASGEPDWGNYEWFTNEEILLDKDGNILWQPKY